MRGTLGLLVPRPLPAAGTAALLAACAAAPHPPETDLAPPTATTATAAPDAEVDAPVEAAPPEASRDAATEDANGGATSDASPAPAPGPAPLAIDGSNCNAGSECESGICEGAGCENGEGICESKARSCSTKLAWYCGCDGKSRQASVDCPGLRFAYQARCAPAAAWSRGAAPDSAPCLRGSQCKSGVCEGHGCDDARPGTCQPAMRGCGQSAVQYCGCDGRSFASNPCPGVRYESIGFCRIDPRSRSQIKVLSVSGKSTPINDELKRALVASGHLRRCHLASGESTFTTTLDFEVDAKGQVRVGEVDGLGQQGSLLPSCISAFGRITTLKATGSAARVSVKLRFELTRSKP